MILSILICHIYERQAQLKRLLHRLLPQIGWTPAQMLYCANYKRKESWTDPDGNTEYYMQYPSWGMYGYSNGTTAEVIVLADERGSQTIGKKRNDLLQYAHGKWCCFHDDDDMCSDDYVSRILGAIASKPDLDVIGMEGVLRRPGFADEPFYHSIKFPTWYSMGGKHMRSPNHLNPVRRELALQAGFPDDSNYGEDHEFSKRLHPLLKNEVMLDGPIYFYECAK